MLKTVLESSQCKIIVTHGTDTIIETAQFLEANLKEPRPPRNAKTVIFTGAFLPEKFKDSDADFNVGLALGAIEALPTDDGHSHVYIALNGLLIPAFKAARKDDGSFMCEPFTIFT